MVTTRSARGTDSCGSCEDRSTDAPSATASPMSCPRSWREGASSPACGSSSSQSAGRRARSAARATRRRWPAESRPVGVVRRRPVRPTRAGRLGPFARQAEGAHGEVDVLRRRQVVVERGGMPQEADVAPDRRVVRGEIDPEDGGLTRGDRQKPSTGAQEAGLAGPVRPHDDGDLTLLEAEIDPGEGGEAAGESDSGAELDNRGHGLRPHGRGGGCRGSKRGRAFRGIPGRLPAAQRMWARA